MRVIVVLLTASLLAACGGGSADDSDDASGSSSGSTTTAQSDTHKDKSGGQQKSKAKPKPPAAPYHPSGAADPYRSRQYGLDEIKLPQAWKEDAGQQTTIAIVDSGIDLQHPDLKARLVPGHDFVSSGGKGKDHNGHGTHVAGIAAAATDNGVGVSGGAPRAKLMPVRVLGKDGSGSQSNIGKGIEWAADHGADVINLSLGESGLAGQLLRGGSLNNEIDHAVKRGAVVVAAAGNDGTASKPYRSSTPVLIVGAVDQDGQPARFSNFGAEDAVTAPGVQVYSTLPTYSTDQSDEHGENYGYLDGTSMAAPYVSAVAALLVAQGRTPQQVVDAIQGTAKNPQHVTKLGLGIVDAAAAVKSPRDIKPKTTKTSKTSKSPQPTKTPRRRLRK